MAEAPKNGQSPRVAERTLARSETFWRVMAFIMAVTVAWVAWLLWQLMPRPVVTDLAYRTPVKPISNLPRAEAPAPAAPDAGPILSGPPMENLKIETELKLPASKASAEGAAQPAASPAPGAPAAK